MIEIRVDQENIRGRIKGFPVEIVERMLYEQYLQKGFYDIRVFIGNECSGFCWSDTVDDFDFWQPIINNKRFDLFFEKYPRKMREVEQEKINLSQMIRHIDLELDGFKLKLNTPWI